MSALRIIEDRIYRRAQLGNVFTSIIVEPKLYKEMLIEIGEMPIHRRDRTFGYEGLTLNSVFGPIEIKLGKSVIQDPNIILKGIL